MSQDGSLRTRDTPLSLCACISLCTCSFFMIRCILPQWLARLNSGSHVFEWVHNIYQTSTLKKLGQFLYIHVLSIQTLMVLSLYLFSIIICCCVFCFYRCMLLCSTLKTQRHCMSLSLSLCYSFVIILSIYNDVFQDFDFTYLNLWVCDFVLIDLSLCCDFFY